MKSYAIPRAIFFFMVVVIFLCPGFVSAEEPQTDSQKAIAIRMIQRDIQMMMRIPLHSGHPFQSIPDSDSNPFRTPIPIHSGHPFRLNPDSPF